MTEKDGDPRRPKRLLYSQTETAELLNMSVKTLVEYVLAGELRYVLVGKRRRFAQTDLDQFIDNRRQQDWAPASRATLVRPHGTRRSKAPSIFEVVASRRLRPPDREQG
jgi:excisionase family DNA binding protein